MKLMIQLALTSALMTVAAPSLAAVLDQSAQNTELINSVFWVILGLNTIVFLSIFYRIKKEQARDNIGSGNIAPPMTFVVIFVGSLGYLFDCTGLLSYQFALATSFAYAVAVWYLVLDKPFRSGSEDRDS